MVHSERPGGFGWKSAGQVGGRGEHGRDDVVEVANLISIKDFAKQFPRRREDLFGAVIIDRRCCADAADRHAVVPG